jgi:hypothetical protein
VHLSVTRGGLSLDLSEWKNIYFPAKNLMSVWRHGVTKLLRDAFKENKLNLPHNIAYLGKYIKRPPIANSRLVHYNGTDIMFRYHDHKSGNSKYYNCDHFDFITRFIQHIPDKRFRMIRYYGFLSNRHRSKLLPIVNRIFNNNTSSKIKMTWRFLYKRTFGINPTDCIVCNSKLRLGFLCIGYSTFDLKLRHCKIAQNKIIR